MAEPSGSRLKLWFQRLVLVALGACLAYATIVAAHAFAPSGLHQTLWMAALAMVALVTAISFVISRRLSRLERHEDDRRRKSSATGVMLREQIAARHAAEASLRAEEMFPQLSPGPVLRFDADGRINRLNPAAEEVLGAAALGRLLWEAVPELSRQDLAACMVNGRTPLREMQAGERWFVAHLRGVPEMGFGGLFALEITDFKRSQLDLQATEIRTRAILDGINDAIVIVVDQGRIQAANPATSRHFGYTHGELIQRNLDVILPGLFEDQSQDRLEALLAVARRRRPGSRDPRATAVRKDGTSFPASVGISAYEINGRPRVSCVIRDITERVQAEEAEARQKLQLERLVQELAEFNYVASHDLQEPLRTMSTYCGLLKRDVGGELPQRAAQDLDAILDASLRMQRLIGDLLEYSRSGNREYRMAPVDLDRVLRRVTGDLKARLQETGGTVTHDPLPQVLGDDTQIGRVLQNLISNGLKFRKSEHPPSVHVSAEKHEGRVRITVADNGIGIESQYVQQLFQPFKRLHAAGRYEGSGIGLAVCRKIIERHGGTIGVTSTPGEGSRFMLDLPGVTESAAGKEQS
ncbi:MAG: PAS domain S-box protein [Planctomycetes bacterium]|nr:PAS domain S-box protein [Planctomycetota bacterium]